MNQVKSKPTSKKVPETSEPPTEPLSPTQTPQTGNENEAAHNSALLNAWINTKMEKDKSLLALATGGIGLLVSLLTATDSKSKWELCLYILTFLCFLITILSTLCVFELNADYIEHIQNNDEVKKTKTARRLTWLDKIVWWSFVIGIVFFGIIGLFSGYKKLKGGNDEMNKKIIQSTEGQANRTDDSTKSLSGLDRLSPRSTSTAAPTPSSVGQSGGGQPSPTSNRSSSPTTPTPTNTGK